MLFKWNSLFVKLLLMFFVLILPLYGLSVWFTGGSAKQMREEIERSNESVLLFHASSLQFELARMSGLLDEYAVDGELADFSTMLPVLSNYETDRRLLNIWLKLRQMKASSPYVLDVRYYLPALSKVVSVIDGISDSSSEEWQGLISRRVNLRGTVTSYRGGFYLAKSAPYSLDAAAEPNFLLVIRLSESELIKQLRNIRKEGTGGAFLTFGDDNGAAIASDDGLREEWRSFGRAGEKGEPSGSVRRDESEQGYYYSFSDPVYSFRLVSYVSKDELFQPIRRYAFWMRSLTVVSCALVIVFTYGIYLFIHEPLIKLIRGFRTIERGDMITRIEHKRGDEFSHLYNQFHQMQRRLRALIDENYVQRIRTQDAELKHLQSQIAPHFLYNSLFTVKQMAELEDTESIKEFSDYLGRYFRFMTRDFSKEVPFADEMDHSLMYLRIQEIRFSRRVKIETDPLPPQYGSLLVPRIILQPILENAFKHGLAQKSSGGTLKLSVRAEASDLIVTVEDNGAKLTDDKLRELQEKVAARTSIGELGETTGLINVHHRLRIHFGAEYGLALSRSPLGGLRTDLVLPGRPLGKD